ncbi:DUF397 domain-containing protein [Streptomyces paludis]|uniref:DUF397 domain-containing protein n=1 Tax=Streptomyces paludis TaxID=2282738 RepID=UPI001E4F15E4|nr:DUF397 domain-containing protein [Streptomyces paludis]
MKAIRTEVTLVWRKSSYSDEEGDLCVEIAACPATVHVRDSKLAPSAGPQFAVAAPAWVAFVAYVHASPVG